MNCEDFLPAIESEEPSPVHEARRHAASCPRCAAAYAALLKVKATLAHHEPLPASARAVWEKASWNPLSESTRRPRWVPALAGLLTSAAACVLVLVLVISKRDVAPGTLTGASPASTTTILEHDSTAELAQLALAVEALDGSLVALAEQVERLEVEREITLTLNQYTSK